MQTPQKLTQSYRFQVGLLTLSSISPVPLKTFRALAGGYSAARLGSQPRLSRANVGCLVSQNTFGDRLMAL